ncbi:hypothetical protein A3K63_03150 [Candidatus Micrarchaeota archaeon RBG_16_49_10]|nr:MAG: hypothetical protein A3K63_03150 [Candidatus Micrarchaeota archaeon RBG_16_49_10]
MASLGKARQKISKAAFLAIFGLFICSTAAGAHTIEYYIIVEENGNSVVVMTIKGSGLINVPIDAAAENIDVQGALYSVNNDSIDVAIGSTREAAVVYSTPSLTRKDANWQFSMDLVDSELTTAVIAISSNATIIETQPKAFIDEHDFKEAKWTDNVTEISMDYYFQSRPIIPPVNRGKWWLIPLGILAVSGIAGGFIFMRKSREDSKLKSKENVLRTLSDNERKIVEMLIGGKGQMKRSKLERESQISKSSLAAALKNLERKKIVELDKTYKTHSVKLTRWFDEM